MERRHFTRVGFETRAVVRFRDKTVSGAVDNLSLKGMFLKTPEAVPAGERGSVRIFLESGSAELSLELEGAVVRCQGDGIAIHFDRMDLDSFFHLKNIVAYNSGDMDGVMKEFLEHRGE